MCTAFVLPCGEDSAPPQRRCDLAVGGLQLGQATAEKALLRLGVGQGQGAFVGLAGIVVATEAAQQVRAGRVQVVVAVEVEIVDQLQARLGPRAAATATARFSATTGEPVSCASSP